MRLTLHRIAAIGVVAGALGLGSIGYAYAQSSTTSPPDTTAPSTNNGDGSGHDPSNCPNMGGSTNSSSSDASQTAYMRQS